MIGRYLSPVREAVTFARQWLSVIRMVPTWAFGRLSTETGVSAGAWKTAVASVVVGLIAASVTVLVLRSRGSVEQPGEIGVESEAVA